ncbi:hypothetical protein EA438_05825 [Streptococcus dysgalactiae subsp. dysgalactiae]|nr:hypothetical protein [Streptococcus dysgalactiae subsp. dysgalactiae]
MKESFGETVLELSKLDMKNDPKNPVVRLYDDGELIGKFSLKTLEVVENIDLADYDIRFAQKELKLNQSNWLETWRDYVGILNA